MSSDQITRQLGTCYYPEHWPQEQWPIDARNMVQLGLKWVRIGEFSWSKLEPSPDKFDWAWMDRAISTLGGAGLKIILGTPTATPPRWMLDKLPDMLGVDQQGKPRKFGSRRNYCFSHLKYRQECARITNALAQRYGGNPHIAAWQTDNEYGCHETTLSYSQSAMRGFQNWLQCKYQTIAALNTAWGNVFWSMEYARFDQIDLPNMTVTEPNPSHVMDFRRYSSDMVVAFNRVQTNILREHTKAPLLHNYMGRIVDFDHFDLGKDLDIATWDSYPLGFLEDRSDQNETNKSIFMSQGDPDFQAFHHDLYRGVGRGRWWVMEQQPGPVNWAPFNPAPLPGMVRLWTWEAFAHGAETVSYFRWRQLPFAQEQMHAGLLRPDGKPAAAFEEIAKLAKEIEEMPERDFKPAKVALVFDYPSAWAWQTQAHGQNFDYFKLVFNFYSALRKLGQSIDIVNAECTDLDAYSLVVIPGLMSASTQLMSKLTNLKGLAILGPRFASKTPDFHITDPLPPNIPHLDCKVLSVQSLRPGAKIQLKTGGAFIHWSEDLTGSANVRETAISGAPAIMQSSNAWYIAGWPDELALTRMMRDACKQCELTTCDMPEGVRLRDGVTHRYVFNYGPNAAVFGGHTIQPAGVAILPNVIS